jgi:sucrose-phosphate synthase
VSGLSGPEVPLVKWLDSQDPKPTVITTHSQILSAFSRSYFHWIDCKVSAAHTIALLEKHAVPLPDILICAGGTELYYGPHCAADHGWQQHIAYRWRPEQVSGELSHLAGLSLREAEAQRPFKISYAWSPGESDLLIRVHQCLSRKKLRYNLSPAADHHLDVLPYRASRGKALRYLSYKWDIPLRHVMACGSSDRDAEMLRGDTCGVVTGNYSGGLEELRGIRGCYFSGLPYAAGILDGIRHYDFLPQRENRELE